MSLGAHDPFLTVSPVCGRRNAAIASAQVRAALATTEAGRDSGVERVQSWRVRPESGFLTRARAEQCGSGELAIWANRVTWREAKPVGDQGRVSARLALRKCPLCEAGLIACAGAKRPSKPSREAASCFWMPDPRARKTSNNPQR